MSTANQFGPVSVKACALVHRPPSSSSNRRRHGWGAAFESTADSSTQRLAPDYGKSTIMPFGVAQGKALVPGARRSRGLLAHAADLSQDGICDAMQNTPACKSQQSKMEVDAGGCTPDDGMRTLCPPAPPSSAALVADVAPSMTHKVGEDSILEDSSEVTAVVKQPRAIRASDPGCKPSAGDPVVAVVPGATRSTLPSSAEKNAPTHGPSTPRSTSAKIKQQSPPEPKSRAVSAVPKQQQERQRVASETGMQSTRASYGHRMPCRRKSDSRTSDTQQQNQRKEPIKGVSSYGFFALYVCLTVSS